MCSPAVFSSTRFHPVTPPPRRIIVAALLTLLAGMFSPPPGRGSPPVLPTDLLTRAGYGSVPIVRPRPGVLAVAVEVNGKPARLVLDTGFDAVFLRREWVTRAAIPVTDLPADATLRGVGGSEERRLQGGTLERLRLGNVEIRRVPVFISDLGLFGATSRYQLRGDGFLGAQFLAACGAIIDLQNLRLYLRAPDANTPVPDLGLALRGSGMTEVPLTRAGLKYLVGATVNGVSTRLVVDTGAFRTLLDRRASDRLGLGSRRGRVRSTDLNGRTQEVQATSLTSFRLGDYAVPAPARVSIANLGLPAAANVTGLLGINVLGNCGGIIDCGANRLFLAGRRSGLTLAGTFDTPDGADYLVRPPVQAAFSRLRTPAFRPAVVPARPRR